VATNGPGSSGRRTEAAGNLVNLSEWASILGIHFWRSTSRAEVDFVFDTGAAIIGLEVKAGKTGRPAIPRSARSFIEAYRPRHFLIVGNERFDSERIEETEVAWITLDELAPTIEEIAG
jgi:predicted AAA+ superfamily ATPase